MQPWLDEQNRLWDAELALLAQQQAQLNNMAGIYRALGKRSNLTQAESVGSRWTSLGGQSRPILPTNQLIIVFISSRMGAIISQEYAHVSTRPANRPRLLTVKHVQDVSPHLPESA